MSSNEQYVCIAYHTGDGSPCRELCNEVNYCWISHTRALLAEHLILTSRVVVSNQVLLFISCAKDSTLSGRFCHHYRGHRVDNVPKHRVRRILSCEAQLHPSRRDTGQVCPTCACCHCRTRILRT